ncbi:hypothetical protein FIBSPDRAFT_286839 [Athelia psychrophila]|uniref:Secreted protein n=1 Tax=Athelia psychrophila TaxID=1759441 RepID=A0A167XRL7_9AGAM|nr:hypothetical protein FIBSPDRAFT_286839 [Fibularhizoctonia sp. CBS 109695]
MAWLFLWRRVFLQVWGATRPCAKLPPPFAVYDCLRRHILYLSPFAAGFIHNDVAKRFAFSKGSVNDAGSCSPGYV